MGAQSKANFSNRNIVPHALDRAREAGAVELTSVKASAAESVTLLPQGAAQVVR
jgi:hypothetical protein